MEKIKQVFSPGSSKDDEVMYGDSEARRKESIANTSGQQQPAKLYPVEGAAGQKESGGILNQITNPDGAKYDERRFETSATSEPDPNKLHTDPASKDRSGSVIGQILNPGGKKYDEQKFGETATTAGTEQVHEKRGVGEKLYPEHGREENQAHYPGLGKTEAAGVVDPNTKLQTKPEHEKDHSILRQILNPNGNKRDDVAYGSTAQASGNNVDVAGASSTLADRSVAHGSGASGVATSSAPRYNEPQSDVLDRSHPLRDGSGATTDPTNPVGTSRTTDAAILGTGAAATGGLASTSETSHAYGGSDTTHHPQGSTLDCDGQPTQGYIHHVKGPHSTDIANQLDPNISGSSGLAAGEQQRNVAAAGAGAGAGAGIGAGIGSGPTTNTTTTTTTTTTGTGYNSSSSHQAGGATVPSQPYSSTSTAPGTTGQTSSHHHEGHLNQDKSAHIRNDEHEKHEKPGLLQKIMHPRSRGEDSHQRTSVDEHGRNVLHKDPPS